MNLLTFFLKRDFKDNKPFWIAPIILFSLLFGLSEVWREHRITAHTLMTGLQICTFLFIFVSATLYGKYLNSVVGTSLHVRTQMSLTRNYLFALPLKRTKLFFINQVRLLVPLFPFILLAATYIVTFNTHASKLSFVGLLLVGLCLGWLVLNYFAWLCYLVERSFENKTFSHALRGFFVYNPVLLLIIYYAFLRNIEELAHEPSLWLVVAFIAPALMMALNYRNWLRRE